MILDIIPFSHLWEMILAHPITHIPSCPVFLNTISAPGLQEWGLFCCMVLWDHRFTTYSLVTLCNQNKDPLLFLDSTVMYQVPLPPPPLHVLIKYFTKSVQKGNFQVAMNGPTFLIFCGSIWYKSWKSSLWSHYTQKDDVWRMRMAWGPDIEGVRITVASIP